MGVQISMRSSTSIHACDIAQRYFLSSQCHSTTRLARRSQTRRGGTALVIPRSKFCLICWSCSSRPSKYSVDWTQIAAAQASVGSSKVIIASNIGLENRVWEPRAWTGHEFRFPIQLELPEEFGKDRVFVGVRIV